MQNDFLAGSRIWSRSKFRAKTYMFVVICASEIQLHMSFSVKYTEMYEMFKSEH